MARSTYLSQPPAHHGADGRLVAMFIRKERRQRDAAAHFFGNGTPLVVNFRAREFGRIFAPASPVPAG